MNIIGWRKFGYFYILFASGTAFTGCTTSPPYPQPPANQNFQVTHSRNTTQYSAEVVARAPASNGGIQAAAVGTTTDASNTGPPKKPGSPELKLTPLSSFDDLDLGISNIRGIMADSYTRLIVKSNLGDPANSTPQNYAYTPRNWFRRYFYGESFDLSLSLKLTIGDYDSTVSLMTISHDSNSDGEQWSRSVNYNALSFPWILVKNDGEISAPVFTATLRGTRTYKSGAAGAALQVALGAINQLAPSSTLLTKLSAQTAKTKASAIDTAIGKLFSDGISEQHISQRDLRTWRENGGVSLTALIPRSEDGGWDDDPVSIGTWRLTFDQPRPSMFADVRLCDRDNPDTYPSPDLTATVTAAPPANDPSKKADATPAPKDPQQMTEPYCYRNRDAALAFVHTKVDSSSILNFHLIESTSSATKDLGTISAYLQQQSFFSTAMTSFKGDTKTDQAVTEKLCRGIMTSMVAMGLNSADSGMVVWAITDGYTLPSSMNEDAFSSPSCKSVTDGIVADRKIISTKAAADAKTVASLKPAVTAKPDTKSAKTKSTDTKTSGAAKPTVTDAPVEAEKKPKAAP